MSAVQVEGLRKRYGGTEAVRGVGFTVEESEIFALLGPNGAGKTTTLEILEGFRQRDEGFARVLGLDPGSRADSRTLRERIGLVLQDIAIEPYLTVQETVQRNAGYYPHPRGVGEVLELVGLGDKRKDKVRNLSGGQKRRLDLALGVVGRPGLLFLDEPTTGFDPNARRAAWEVVRNLRADGTTILLTTHYMDEAQELADTVAVMAEGEIVATGPPETVGGRASGRAEVAFTLPEGVFADELPLAMAPDENGRVAAEVEDATSALHEITGWALERGLSLEGLTVSRPTLEDVYLSLTRNTAEDGASAAEPVPSQS
ncbi:ABC transporter ATP-binding protein [Streptomonospora algeriensis]|uniref:ABC transporter ATP-binding protein n=1 Tax=Streptomonospora algeriensis TaxID=995084 RepID=A0ABW3BG98_9ACTN